MNFIQKYFYTACIILLAVSCSSDTSIKDEEKPTITIDYNGGFPQACQTLQRGETYLFKAQTTDNMALAAYSIDIHHNFDHHTHDDQEETCTLENTKNAINPLIFIENYTIENDVKSFEINISVTIPDNIDTGDYHCSYSVTDETGWQSRTSVDIKII
ncbi:DUF4625 domain-containing protein [Algibacter pacificus]|uniref:DUF4625 domain-containing protein n=1 Tax=Algibacter pacificus TaxID=2599389 RepID=UPI0011C7FB7D|nr:DUF4625 domain-containing protein [Algibacter pacificus]